MGDLPPDSVAMWMAALAIFFPRATSLSVTFRPFTAECTASMICNQVAGEFQSEKQPVKVLLNSCKKS